MFLKRTDWYLTLILLFLGVLFFQWVQLGQVVISNLPPKLFQPLPIIMLVLLATGVGLFMMVLSEIISDLQIQDDKKASKALSQRFLKLTWIMIVFFLTSLLVVVDRH